MKTISIQIGNSDDKLSQAQWSDFVQAVDKTVTTYASQVHFFGGASGWLRWQNTAWVFECKDESIPPLREALTFERKNYGQDSLAYTEGETVFL